MSFPRYCGYKASGLSWVAQVPEHWVVPAVGYRYEVLLGKMLDEKKITGKHLAPYLRNIDVQWDRIDTENLPQMDFHGDDLARYRLVSGDLLVCEGGDVGRAAVWRGQLNECYYQKALHRLRPWDARRDNPRFFLYVLRVASALGVFSVASGKSTIAHLTAESLRGHRFAFPPFEEQKAIVGFLDYETTKIDKLMSEQQRLIDLLKEKRQAVISNAVTKGINPAVSMKPSEVLWIGDMPEHWKISQSRRMFAVRSEPALPTDKMLTASQKYGVLYQTDFVEREGRRVVEVIMGIESLKHVEPDDFIISMRSFQGGIEWCRLRGSTSFHYVMVKPINGVHPPFFAHLFKSQVYIQALRATTDLIRDGQELRFSNFVQVDLPLVPIEEQRQIAGFLDRETMKLDALTTEAQSAIQLLQERRAALISVAVTGKIDVRTIAQQVIAA
jgi:type I restriction enzyme, S subunit